MKRLLCKTIFYGVLMSVVATACTNDNLQTSPEGGKVAVRVSGGVQTRATNNIWDVNDAIGITMVSPQSVSVIEPYRNYSYSTSGDGNFSPTDASKIIYFPSDGTTVSFKAYYPYKRDLSTDMLIPVNTKDQTSLADIDLMTADHVSGNSIDEPNVKLNFYHRLAKVSIDLATDETGLINLEGCKLTMKGLKTSGAYDLMKDGLSVDANSGADVNIPLRNNQGEAILLPRAAAEGVTFLVTTANGGTYTAILDKDLELKAGYKHTFHIRLKSTPVLVSATITPWIEGPERQTDVIRVVTGLNDSRDFQPNDVLNLYLKDKDDTNFNYLTTFTYGTDNKWITNKQVYWESIKADPAAFRGATTIAKALNGTQIADILVSKDVSVSQYTGVNLEMTHAGSKVTIQLKSSDGTFTTGELKNASIILPGYLNTGSVNANGTFVIGNSTIDIVPESNVAIFPPQTIGYGKNLATITINGRTYDLKVTEANGFEYVPGVAYTLTADLKKASVLMSALVTPWTEETHEFQDVRIGLANLGSNGGDLKNGDQLYLYTGDNASRIDLNGYFAYNGSGWNYSNPSTPLYWEDIANSGYIYASITRPALSNASGNNQSQDYITAIPVANAGGVTNTAINLTMTHQVAKVNVILWSNTYSEAKLTAAKVTLPNYDMGGSMNKGLYSRGTLKGTITLDNPVKVIPTQSGAVTTYNTASYLQEQTVAKQTPLVIVEIDGRSYTVKHTDDVAYTSGKITNLKIQIEKSDLKVSVDVANWVDQLPIIFDNAMFFTVANPTASGFVHNDQIKFYELGLSNTVTNNTNTYTYSVSGSTASLTNPKAAWYRDDFQTGDAISGVFPVLSQTNVAAGASTFNWTCSNGSGGSSTNGHNQDVIIAAPNGNHGTIQTGSANVAFQFKHVLSKVSVNLIVGTGFTASEIAGSVVELNNFKLSGTVNVATGSASPTGAVTSSFQPTILSAPNAVTGKTVVSSYEAFIMPQTITAASASKTTIVTVTLNGVKFYGQLSADKLFAAGEHNVLNITLNKVGLALSTELVDWTYGGSYDMDLH